MKKNTLTSNKGLSLSQAQSVSNLCNQRAKDIDAKLDGLNNYHKSVEIVDGKGNSKGYVTVTAKKIPTDVVELLLEKSGLHACQAFLMENIKAKEAMLQDIKKGSADISTVEVPDRPKLVNVDTLAQVSEDFGWSALTASEVSEYTEAEAFAAHIGQFIHKGGTLDRLRTELPTIPAVEWMNIHDGMKSPVVISVHHNSEDLLATHEKLAELHRGFEQRVNYFKSKVKNITTEENARIAKLNADAINVTSKQNKDAQATYQTAYMEATEKMKNIQADFEKERQAKIKEIASLRIGIDARFQKVIDIFLAKLSNTQE